jgi:hypothetical protein
MPKVYFYKLTADNGGAPCIDGGLLSLAICKPMIRSGAEEGDLIFGFAANSLSGDNRIIYVARVTKTLPDGRYYKDARYVKRGDCIYAFKSGRFIRKRHAQHHRRSQDLAHDLGAHPAYERAHVLLSDDFRYFGKAGTDDYKRRFPLMKRAVERLGRGHRVHCDRALYSEFLKMRDWLWRSGSQKVIGLPTSAPSARSCHRSISCNVVSTT